MSWTPGRPTGRFAPSPTGPLHAGSVVAALASWLDARAASGRWLLRIEDIDGPRCVPGAAETILRQLADLGLLPDERPWLQSSRAHAYQAALEQLERDGVAYPCACTRKEIEAAWAATGLVHLRDDDRPYPGTCRGGLGGRPARAMRFRCPGPGDVRAIVHWTDRRLGQRVQNVSEQVGDFVLKRADGLWAYQLAVVVDDAAQGVTDIVRGEDLADNTPRQILLQRALGYPTPRYLHTPLVLAADGHKLSKQNGAQAVDTRDALAVLRCAGEVLGARVEATTAADWRQAAVRQWQTMFGPP